MVSNLAGSLALVTCKEPLRVSIGSHMRQLLNNATPGTDQQTMELLVQQCSADNLELGCMLIEKAATEKAMRDVDEAMAPSLQVIYIDYFVHVLGWVQRVYPLPACVTNISGNMGH